MTKKEEEGKNIPNWNWGSIWIWVNLTIVSLFTFFERAVFFFFQKKKRKITKFDLRAQKSPILNSQTAKSLFLSCQISNKQKLFANKAFAGCCLNLSNQKESNCAPVDCWKVSSLKICVHLSAKMVLFERKETQLKRKERKIRFAKLKKWISMKRAR